MEVGGGVGAAGAGTGGRAGSLASLSSWLRRKRCRASTLLGRPMARLLCGSSSSPSASTLVMVVAVGRGGGGVDVATRWIGFSFGGKGTITCMCI